MIITMDIGNTSIKTGIFEGDQLVGYVRFSTDFMRTSDEFGLMLLQFMKYKGLDWHAVKAAAFSSVVPSINFTIEHMYRSYFNFEPLVIGPGIKTGLNIRYDNPREVGSDRIASCVAAQELYGGPCIVIDFGTATTFNAISAQGEFLGGAIMPGVKLSSEALVNFAAKLPRIELVKPDTIINRTTTSNMQAGIIYGYIGAVDKIVQMMREELQAPKALVIATGGMAQIVYQQSGAIDKINGRLTLEGLRIIYERNKEKPL